MEILNILNSTPVTYETCLAERTGNADVHYAKHVCNTCDGIALGMNDAMLQRFGGACFQVYFHVFGETTTETWC